MPEYDLAFSPFSIEETGSFKLLELPPELTTLIESSIERSEPLSLSIKGDSTEDAILCTKDRTYSIRSVNLSNSILVVSPPPDSHASDYGEDAVVIRDQVNQILELAPAVPKLQKLFGLLRRREYDENEEEHHEDDVQGESQRYTYKEAREQIQASDAELDDGLKDRRILILNDELRPIAPTYLNQILELTLNLLVSLSQPHAAASVEAITSALADDYEISRVVSTQILSWFGEIRSGKWKMNVSDIIKEMGLGLLRNHKHDSINKGLFMTNWKAAVGDIFAEEVHLNILAGNYLEHKYGITDEETLTYFPASSLPADPAARFADLFLTRTRWRGDEITAFLTDVAVDTKERDKLLLKYCRSITESGKVWYTARSQYNG